MSPAGEKENYWRINDQSGTGFYFADFKSQTLSRIRSSVGRRVGLRLRIFSPLIILTSVSRCDDAFAFDILMDGR